MSYKTVTAIALGSVATSIGIMHFDPKRDDEDGRYQTRILPEADAEKAVRRELVEITGDATEQEFKRQQAGFSARPADVAAQRIADLPDDETAFLAGGTATGTAASRNYAPGQGPDANLGGGDPDAAPVANEEPGPLDQSVDKLTEYLATVDSVETLDALAAAETAGKSRKGALDAIAERRQAITEAA